jgi:DNA-binding LacI/PurR family transcriptional regulator
VESVLSDHGYALLLQMVSDPDRERQSYRRLASEGRVDGVFVTDLLVADERPELLSEIGLPAVILGPGNKNPYWPVVGADDAPGIVAAVEHLLALGHTRIAHVGGPSAVVHGVSRREAWCGTLRAAGLPDAPFVETDFSAESGAAATRHLLDLDEPPTAVIYANDLMAMAGLSLAVSRGIDVPGRLSIVGFDDTEIAAHLQPALTSVRQDAIAWGRAAATRLLELIDGTDPTPVELAPAALVIRASTGPANSGAAYAAPSPRRRSTTERARMEKQ